jgi:peptidoglycan L-alanyl-D-glutamate endopeptidase CwlK
MNIDQIIRAVQKELAVDADGKAGPQTWQAIYDRIVPKSQQTAPTVSPANGDSVDPRSEGIIATLLPEVHPYARALVHQAAVAGIEIKLISGLRTYAEQDELYAQGRTKPGKIVTNAKGGHSNHNFGIAFDIGVFENGNYLDESPAYKGVGAIGVGLGLEWGGNWKTIEDQPHFQLRPKWAANEPESDMLAELRARKDSSKGVYA